jgi:DNA/RNA endonuclease G (NUC1)
MAKTFTYINCALQHQDLNRGVWKNLEVFERNLASTGAKVKVTIKVDFTNAKKLSTGATVPTGFWKVIEADGKVYEFYFLNVTPTKSDFMLYQTNCCK